MNQLKHKELLQMQADAVNSVVGESVVKCSTCNNKGYIHKVVYRQDDFYDGYEIVVAVCEDCELARLMYRYSTNAGITDYEKFSFKKFEPLNEEQEVLINGAKKFISVGARGFFYVGGCVGSGKTKVAKAICLELIKTQKRKVTVMNWRSDAVRLKGIINDKAYTDEMERYKRADVLLIDDCLKAGQQTPAELGLLYEIINARYEDKNKCTLITSEVFMDEIQDNSIKGRIREASFGNVYRMTRKEENDQRLRGDI